MLCNSGGVCEGAGQNTITAFFMASPVPQHLDIASPKVSLRCLLMSDSERNKARVNALLK